MDQESSSAANRLLRRSTTVSFYMGLGVLAGFVVDVLVVARFGIGTDTDAFFAGYTVPFILITRMTAIQPVLVSILSGYRQRDRAFAVLLNAVTLIGLAVGLVGAALAHPIVALTAPGFDASMKALAAQVAAILFTRVPLAAIAEVCRSELYLRRHFSLATLGSAVPSLVTAAILLVTHSQTGIVTVAWAFVAGAVTQALLLAGWVFGRLRLPYRLTLHYPQPLLRQAGRMVAGPLLGLFLRQGVTLAERLLGSYLPAGSLTALSYANRLNTIVAGVFFEGVTTAGLPGLAEHFERGRIEAAHVELRTLLRMAIAVSLPVGLAVAALGTPLVRLFFERGQVDPAAAWLLGSVLSVYCLSLPFLGVFRAAQTFFYAVKEVRPVVIQHTSVAVLAVVLDLVLVGPLGAMGLAWGYVVACATVTLAALAWLARRAAALDWRTLAGSAWRLGLASGAMAATMFATSRLFDMAAMDIGRWGLLLSLTASGLAGLAVLVVVGAALHVEEIALVRSAIKGRWATIVRTNS